MVPAVAGNLYKSFFQEPPLKAGADWPILAPFLKNFFSFFDWQHTVGHVWSCQIRRSQTLDQMGENRFRFKLLLVFDPSATFALPHCFLPLPRGHFQVDF